MQEATPHLRLLAAYADDETAGHPEHLRMGQGLVGQCAIDGRRMLILRIKESRLQLDPAANTRHAAIIGASASSIESRQRFWLSRRTIN